MSEPQTSAKVVIYTTKGRIDIELWAKEKPSHARRFLEACHGGSLIDQSLCQLSKNRDCIMMSKLSSTEKLPSEHNGRIRFSKAGMLGWDCRYQRWFITLSVFADNDDERIALGKLVDNSIYSLRRIVDESELDSENCLKYPATICKVEVTIPFFSDLQQAAVNHKASVSKKEPSVKAAKVRIRYNYDEDDEDDEGSIPAKRMKIKLPAIVAEPRLQEYHQHNPEEEIKEGDRAEDSDEVEEEDKEEHDVKEEYENIQKEIIDTGSLTSGKRNLDSREQETLRMLALFEERMKGKTIINRPSDVNRKP